MKKVKVLLAAVLSVTTILGATAPAHAAAPESEVQIEIRQTDVNVSVTVPSTLPIVFNSDGTNAFPSSWSIHNSSRNAGIHLVKVNLNADGSGWKLLKESERVKTQTVNGKGVRFLVGQSGAMKVVEPSNGSESETGTATFAPGDIPIAAGTEKSLCFDMERGAFNETKAAAKAFTMVLEFAFN